MSLEDDMRDFGEFLDSVQVVGHPKRHEDLAELDRLIEKYPEETRRHLASLNGM